MFGLGFSEIIVVCIIALIFIGPKQLPEVAKAIARFLNELKRASEEVSKSIYSKDERQYSEDEHNKFSQPQPQPQQQASQDEHQLSTINSKATSQIEFESEAKKENLKKEENNG